MAFAVAFVAFVRGATRLPCIMVGGKQRGRATRDDDDGPKKVSLVPQLLLAIDWLATFFELNKGVDCWPISSFRSVFDVLEYRRIIATVPQPVRSLRPVQPAPLHVNVTKDGPTVD